MKITDLMWDEGTIEHVAAHGVTHWEVAEVFERGPRIRRGRERRYQAAGTTEAGRHLVVYFRYVGNGIARPITARDMTSAERRTYARK